MRNDYWKPYVSVAERRAKAKVEMAKLAKKQGIEIQPVEIEGRKIAKSFWGSAWCDHLESFADLMNRLERGRTYARNGSVCHLEISEGEVKAMVSGSEIYNVKIGINKLSANEWQKVKAKCTGKVDSMLSLLQGKLPDEVLESVTDKKNGLFPSPKEISFSCDCPDYASMCKHIAAVFYGIGARLDHQPELLFSLRGVDHSELISEGVEGVDLGQKEKGSKRSRRRITDDSLADVFDIEMTETLAPRRPSAKKTTKKATKSGKKKAAKKAPRKKVSTPFMPTRENVAALRKKFRMSPIEFALLLGVSTQSVNNWEASSGKLSLRAHSNKSLLVASKYTKKKAWETLQDG